MRTILGDALYALAKAFGLVCLRRGRHSDVFGYDRYQQPMCVCVLCGRQRRS